MASKFSNRRDKVILNALPPQTAPASSPKSVLHGALDEVALLKALPLPAITSSLWGMGLLARFVAQLLSGIALEGASVLLTRPR
jgi:hypothetical protein